MQIAPIVLLVAVIERVVGHRAHHAGAATVLKRA
jgi:hypothetical protein